MKPTTAALPATLFCLVLTATAQQQPQPAPHPAVTTADSKQWLGKLASPEFEGRGTGQDGFRKAADYVRDHFKALGLEPGGPDGSWFQDLPWTQSRPDVASAKLVFRRGGREVVVPGARLAGTVSKALDVQGDVVLVPVDADDAVADLDLAGKVVVLVPASAPPPDGDSRRDRGSPPFRMLRALQGKNVAAIAQADQAAVTAPLQGSSLPAGQNRAARGARMFPATVTFGGADLDALLALAGQKALPVTPLPVPVACALKIDVTDEAAPACNVVGVLRGSDPKLNSEYVVIGSHLDHLGRRGGTWYPGADDDGSGTTGVMAAAQMFARGARPARSVLFVCFCGEELGLVGSDWFVRHPPIPLAAIVGELQMDMIGRCEEEGHDGPRLVNRGERAEDNRNTVHLIGSQKLSPELHDICMQQTAKAGFDIEWDQESLFSRSDHANFGKMGVPIAFFFTGLHRDYHQPTDTPDKIDYDKLLRVATWVHDIALELATRAQRPRVDPALWRDYPNHASGKPAAPLLGDDAPATQQAPATGEAPHGGGR